MKENKLISMIEYVLETKWFTFEKITNYANFLKQPPTINMFVPVKKVDGACIVLEEPKPRDFYIQIENSKEGKKRYNTNRTVFEKALEEYQKAKSEVIFEGFEVDKIKSKSPSRIWITNNDRLLIWDGDDKKFELISINPPTIEDLVKYNLLLTAEKAKELGLTI